MQQIQVPKVLDVEAVERELAILWTKSADRQTDEDGGVMRARVANLVVLTPSESRLENINATVHDLSEAHPCRALVIIAEREAIDRDIELFVSSFSHADGPRKRLSCEEIVLIARGKFVPELPSAALPLLVSDLPIFLWWRDQLIPEDRTFGDFTRAADRLIIDTAESAEPLKTLLAVDRVLSTEQNDHLGISDINWARLTSWRALLAGFYDPPHCRTALEKIHSVVIEYSAPESDSSALAPQSLLFAGWLISRLGWSLSNQPAMKKDAVVEFQVTHAKRPITVGLNRVERADIRPGRLARAQLTTEDNAATFVVARHESGLHLETEVIFEGEAYPRRVLPVRNRTTAQLVAREMEILCNDNIYTEAVKMAISMIQLMDK